MCYALCSQGNDLWCELETLVSRVWKVKVNDKLNVADSDIPEANPSGPAWIWITSQSRRRLCFGVFYIHEAVESPTVAQIGRSLKRSQGENSARQEIYFSFSVCFLRERVMPSLAAWKTKGSFNKFFSEIYIDVYWYLYVPFLVCSPPLSFFYFLFFVNTVQTVIWNWTSFWTKQNMNLTKREKASAPSLHFFCFFALWLFDNKRRYDLLCNLLSEVYISLPLAQTRRGWTSGRFIGSCCCFISLLLYCLLHGLKLLYTVWFSFPKPPPNINRHVAF